MTFVFLFLRRDNVLDLCSGYGAFDFDYGLKAAVLGGFLKVKNKPADSFDKTLARKRSP